MSNTFKVRSTSITKLNEALQKLVISEGAEIVKNPLLEADGKFTSIIDMDKEFDPSTIEEVEIEDEEKEKELVKKTELVNQVTSKLKQALQNNEEINNLLKKIDKINDDTKTNQWQLNSTGNTASLKDKNAQIFKQNDNLCLSINDDIHLFDSVNGLHEYLTTHGLPLPKGIKLSESKLSEKGEQISLLNQSDKTKDLINRGKELFAKAKSNGIVDANTIFSELFDPGSVYELNTMEDNDLDLDDSEVEECTTTGDIGMAVQYTGNKKEEASLDEDWSAPEAFGLVDDKGDQIKFKSIIDGSRAIWKLLANDKAFALNDDEQLQLTKEEVDRWKNYSEQLNNIIIFAIPTICKKMANDYVNESIEKSGRGLSPEQIRENVQNIFGYTLSDEQIAAMLKRNSKGKNVDSLDPSMVRTDEEEAIVVEAKRAMGQAKSLRETAIDEIFEKSGLEARKGYGKYKKFTALSNKKGGIKIVKAHAEPVDMVAQRQKQASQKTPSETIYDLMFNGKMDQAKEMIKALDKDNKKAVFADLVAKNPRLEKLITPMFKESTESLGETFLKSIGA